MNSKMVVSSLDHSHITAISDFNKSCNVHILFQQLLCKQLGIESQATGALSVAKGQVVWCLKKKKNVNNVFNTTECASDTYRDPLYPGIGHRLQKDL